MRLVYRHRTTATNSVKSSQSYQCISNLRGSHIRSDTTIVPTPAFRLEGRPSRLSFGIFVSLGGYDISGWCTITDGPSTAMLTSMGEMVQYDAITNFPHMASVRWCTDSSTVHLYSTVPCPCRNEVLIPISCHKDTLGGQVKGIITTDFCSKSITVPLRTIPQDIASYQHIYTLLAYPPMRLQLGIAVMRLNVHDVLPHCVRWRNRPDMTSVLMVV